jgi:hypothetical protein
MSCASRYEVIEASRYIAYIAFLRSMCEPNIYNEVSPYVVDFCTRLAGKLLGARNSVGLSYSIVSSCS